MVIQEDQYMTLLESSFEEPALLDDETVTQKSDMLKSVVSTATLY
jgi:hypothetical protein